MEVCIHVCGLSIQCSELSQWQFLFSWSHHPLVSEESMAGVGERGEGVSEHLVVSAVSVGSSVCVWFDDPLVSVDSVEVSLYVCGLKIH